MKTLLRTTLCSTLLAGCALPPPAPPRAPAPVAVASPAAVAPPVAAAAPAASAVALAPGPAAAAPAPAPPPPLLPFDEAVLSAANMLLGKAQLPEGGGRHSVVIDPLIDGMTGAQTRATQDMGRRIVELIRQRYAQQYEVQPFNVGTVSRSPLVLIGTFTGVNKERKTEGTREAFRICLALADLRSGRLVGKGLAFALPEGVDSTPGAAFRDAPAWLEDPATLGYIRTCQGTRAGDPIHPLYVDRILVASMLAEALEAYDAGRYKEALSLYDTVARTEVGRQLRTYTGLYLTHLKLGHRADAARAFGQIVDQGLETRRLGVKFLFRPGSTAFWTDAQAGAAPYPMWLGEIAARAAQRQSCLEVVGHTSATGPEPVNERLSQLRAEYVKGQIERTSPALAGRLIANGRGSRETLVGNGRDDASDALDRRVEFKVVGC